MIGSIGESSTDSLQELKTASAEETASGDIALQLQIPAIGDGISDEELGKVMGAIATVDAPPGYLSAMKRIENAKNADILLSLMFLVLSLADFVYIVADTSIGTSFRSFGVVIPGAMLSMVTLLLVKLAQYPLDPWDSASVLRDGWENTCAWPIIERLIQAGSRTSAWMIVLIAHLTAWLVRAVVRGGIIASGDGAFDDIAVPVVAIVLASCPVICSLFYRRLHAYTQLSCAALLVFFLVLCSQAESVLVPFAIATSTGAGTVQLALLIVGLVTAALQAVDRNGPEMLRLYVTQKEIQASPLALIAYRILGSATIVLFVIDAIKAVNSADLHSPAAGALVLPFFVSLYPVAVFQAFRPLLPLGSTLLVSLAVIAARASALHGFRLATTERVNSNALLTLVVASYVPWVPLVLRPLVEFSTYRLFLPTLFSFGPTWPSFLPFLPGIFNAVILFPVVVVATMDGIDFSDFLSLNFDSLQGTLNVLQLVVVVNQAMLSVYFFTLRRDADRARLNVYHAKQQERIEAKKELVLRKQFVESESVNRILVFGTPNSDYLDVLVRMLESRCVDRAAHIAFIHERLRLGITSLIHFCDRNDGYSLKPQLLAARAAVIQNRQLSLLDVNDGISIESRWSDRSIQDAAQRIELPSDTQSLLDRARAICSNDYRPTREDTAIRLQRSAEMLDEVIVMNGCRFRIVDATRQRNELKKWIHMFGDGKIVLALFFVGLDSYSETLYEHEPINRLQESIDRFKTICQQSTFETTAFLVLFTRDDDFREKLPKVPITESFFDYSGRPGDYDDALNDFHSIASPHNRSSLRF